MIHLPSSDGGLASALAGDLHYATFHESSTTIQRSFPLNIKNHLSLLLVASAAVISGCATTTAPTGSAPQPATASTAELPTLKVTLDCGPCVVKPSIPFLIASGYNEAAAKAGRKVTAAKEASLTVKSYVAREDAARFLAGAFAGKDEIKAVVTYQGKTYSVEDYYRNAWLGIETLAKKIGEMSYAELK
jgi:basic membrane lipoprotein Med (substrate-binding protein (PBP1-ABC) superfamily)